VINVVRLAVAALTLAGACAVTGGAGAPAASASAAATANPGRLTATVARPLHAISAAARGREIFLINGDRLDVTAGRAAVAERGTAAGLGTVVVIRSGTRQYAIPVDAVPYLDHGLDPRLFEISSLVAAENDGRLPVRVTYPGRLPDLPGITITSAARGAAEGYLTARSAAAFGAALESRFASGRARGRHGTGRMLGGGVTISLPGTGANTPGTHPRFVMRTLTVRGVNASGQPDSGDYVVVLNIDDPGAFGVNPGAENVFYKGESHADRAR
jgi:hypothetical protein